ncbi:tunicamycin resistance protein [Ktedonosporobacter rubrisoli]|uniref:Tunicamycin resistance protein n=1 Tax=Ktedonosporobacter rubrisoli TaxID=2509675 RepID=A0A4P6JZC1_KTERU|nr:AAA family ATPase [Ktedonosporobacter rubrisoli]QBD80945.1 tunicamycin resistance protein [Ktedonosporobacter rubrisoli]
MIVMLNGSFAVGKTTAAELLVERLYHSMLYDPEVVGAGLAHIVRPIEGFSDFQDLTAWRELVIETARVLKRIYGRTLVVPMTLWHRPYFEEIVAGLRGLDPHLYHFCLTARKETLHKRLAQRQHEHTEQALTWIRERMERCLAAFEAPAFALQIPTDERTPSEIVELILTAIEQESGLIGAGR